MDVCLSFLTFRTIFPLLFGHNNLRPRAFHPKIEGLWSSSRAQGNLSAWLHDEYIVGSLDQERLRYYNRSGRIGLSICERPCDDLAQAGGHRLLIDNLICDCRFQTLSNVDTSQTFKIKHAYAVLGSSDHGTGQSWSDHVASCVLLP